ncbi:MAG: hypothetical protein ACR2KQ_06740 [Actinomycetota bacterium]
MATVSFCTSCGRNVYLETGADLTCPVCSSPLIPSETVTESQAERVGGNEAWFRDVNERVVKEGVWSDQAVVCECGRKECSEFIDIGRDAYDEVRRFRDRFIIKPGHEIPGAEIIVEKQPAYYVAEKIGPGKRIAEETDPRSEG